MTHPNTLGPGERLFGSQALSCPDGSAQLRMQPDGNLVLVAEEVALWSSETSGNPGAFLLLSHDGNLVVRGPDLVPLWATSTSSSGAYLVLQDDWNVVLYSEENAPVWSWDARLFIGDYPATPIALNAGEEICRGEALYSEGCRSRVVMESTGEVFVENPQGRRRLTPEVSGNARCLRMQEDGNLVLYDFDDRPLWATWTYDSGSSLTIGDDGRLVICGDSGKAWTFGFDEGENRG